VNTFKKAVVVAVLALSAPLAFSQQPAGSGTAPAAAAYKAKTPKLNRAQIDALLQHPENLVVIDVRRPDELTAIGGFPAYLSIQAGDLEKYLAYIPKDRTIVTVSNHAARAGVAADLLASKGYKVAGTIGVENYQEEGGTLTKISAPPPKVADAGKSAATH
jgi:rhodanese-related sulfurtransferase